MASARPTRKQPREELVSPRPFLVRCPRMDIVSLCRLRVAGLLWQPRAGAHALTILCKATFALRPGESPLAEEQDAPSKLDIYPKRGS
jgi:hypothetical protein